MTFDRGPSAAVAVGEIEVAMVDVGEMNVAVEVVAMAGVGELAVAVAASVLEASGLKLCALDISVLLLGLCSLAQPTSANAATTMTQSLATCLASSISIAAGISTCG